MMRHGRKIHRLGRPADQRKALLRALTTQLLTHGAIETTKTKAKAVRPWIDKMVNLAKDGSDSKKNQARDGSPTHRAAQRPAGGRCQRRLAWAAPRVRPAAPRRGGVAARGCARLQRARDRAAQTLKRALTPPSSPCAQAYAWIYDRKIVEALFDEAPARYANRRNDYSFIKLQERKRRGDGVELVLLSLV